MTPNLNDDRPRQHATHCRALANPPSRDHLSGPKLFRLDDLRECEHGRIQIVAKTNGRMQCPGTWAWEDLPKLFNRREWNRARDLLAFVPEPTSAPTAVAPASDSAAAKRPRPVGTPISKGSQPRTSNAGPQNPPPSPGSGSAQASCPPRDLNAAYFSPRGKATQ
ncbi:hypothetical protein RCH22_000959 [Cryobacterium psychrotolerans]|nr:hypothetical protein [Cryobacterium psychrotolerans]MEC5149240.1 hypothetical protein [Cryobacterium psychrotolerans]MEC5149318.1 hypothetical protein [Cryobacterium psychrotolerans]